MSAVTIGTKAYFLKGYSEDFEHDIHVYNGADGTWTTLDISASNRRRLMTAAAVGNKLLCIGGLNESTSQEVDELNVYDTDLGTWTKLTMSSEKQGVRAVTVDNKCYLVGGSDGNNARADLDIYDGTTNTIQTGAFCEFGRVNHAIGAFNGQIIIGGGGTISAQYSPIEVYDIAMDTWVQLYTYSFPGNKNHYRQTGVSTPIGVFFGGGETNFFDVIESRVFILNTVVSTTQPVSRTLQVQPTLATQQINIRLPELRNDQYQQGEIMLEVLNMQGQVVATKAALPNSGNWDLSVEGMAAGTYALRMVMGEQVYIGRFVKL
jgi:N-acetylneuraminic acid mutarotase